MCYRVFHFGIFCYDITDSIVLLSCSYGYAFLAASKLSGDLKKIYDLIEDVIAQADEVDEKYLQVFGNFIFTVLLILKKFTMSTLEFLYCPLALYKSRTRLVCVKLYLVFLI